MKIQDSFKVDRYCAVVTGGASGIGLAFAEALAENGARVTVMDVNAASLDREINRMKALGWDVQGVVVDVSDRKALHDAFDQAVAHYGRLDVAFANAGIDPGPGFAQLTPQGEWIRPPELGIENYEDERWDRVIEVNLNSVFTTVKAAARHMKPRKSGRIIITTSVAAIRNEVGIGAAYMAAKAGAAHFMRNAALELAAYNITVNAIAPGPIVTNIGNGSLKNPAVQAAFCRMVPLGRVGNPEELKALALYLASPASSYVTGEQFVIDGGAQLNCG